MADAITSPPIGYTLFPVSGDLAGDLTGTAVRADFHGGRFRVHGYVKVGITPVSERVLLFSKVFVITRVTQSDAVTGEYVFDYVNAEAGYVALATDHTGEYKPVASDELTIELIQ